MYLVPFVLRMLFHNSFDVVKSAVHVDVSPLYVMRLPLTAMRIQLGSSFCGRESTTTLAEVHLCPAFIATSISPMHGSNSGFHIWF